MDTAAAAGMLIRDHGMKHLMVENILQKPERHEGLIQQRIDANDSILFLDRSKNKIIFWPMFSPATPYHFITTQPAAKMSLV